MLTPEWLHVLFDEFDSDPLLFAGVVVCIIVVGSVLVAATIRRVHPLVLWTALAVGFFTFSQVFPENRNQKPSLLIIAAIGSAVMTAWWSWRVAPFIREKLGLPERPKALFKERAGPE